VPLKPLTKVGIVAAGYIAALLIAWTAVAVNGALADTASAQASSGMSAFGDAILFIGVFGIVALAPTGAALFFLVGYYRARTARPSAR
jgi:hypothetical protein